MHHWEVGGPITIGWPDYGIAEKTYTVVELDRLGQVFRVRVTDTRTDPPSRLSQDKGLGLCLAWPKRC